MKACFLSTPAAVETNPLQYGEFAKPEPAGGEVLVRVQVCGVCRTDLHVVEGELPPKRSPVIPGHQVVGRIEARGAERSASRRERAWASPGCTRQTAPANTAGAEKRICAMPRSSPGTA